MTGKGRRYSIAFSMSGESTMSWTLLLSVRSPRLARGTCDLALLALFALPSFSRLHLAPTSLVHSVDCTRCLVHTRLSLLAAPAARPSWQHHSPRSSPRRLAPPWCSHTAGQAISSLDRLFWPTRRRLVLTAASHARPRAPRPACTSISLPRLRSSTRPRLRRAGLAPLQARRSRSTRLRRCAPTRSKAMRRSDRLPALTAGRTSATGSEAAPLPVQWVKLTR